MNELEKSINEDADEGYSRLLKRWVVALCILAIGTTAFTEIQGQWFNSYVKVAVGALFGVGILIAITAVIGAVFYLVWGTVSDNIWTKYGRRVPIYLIGALTTSILMFLFIITTNFFLLLIIGGVLISITANMCHVTNKGLIPDLVPQRKRGRINSILFVMGNIASMLVWIPAIILMPGGGEPYSLEIHQIFIGTVALIFAVSGIFLFILVKEPKVAPPSSTWTKDLKNLLSVKEMSQHKDFMKLFFAMIFLVISEAAFMPYLLILLESISLEVFEILIVLPFVGAGIGIGIYLIGKYTDKIGRKKIALICVISCPIGQFIIAFLGGSSFWLVIGFGIMMPFYLGIWISTDSWVQDLLPEQSRGRFLGILNIGYAIGRVPGALIAGAAGDAFGILSIFFVAGIFLWIGIPFFLRVPETLKT